MITTVNDKIVTVYEMTGNDVLIFLNNQVVSELKPPADFPKLTAICNPKGRIIFTLILFSQSETTYVAVDASLGDNFLQYINMRRFRMDVKINKSSVMLAINNEPKQPDLNGDLVFTDDSDMSMAEADEFWLFMFKTGLPWITSKSSENFIPQHLNLDQLAVIDFDKGCYPGQEIVARLHFLGKVKKRMKYIQYRAEQAYVINSKVQLPEYNEPLEFCAPTVLHQGKWHSQAIISTKNS